MKRDDLYLIRKVILDKVREATIKLKYPLKFSGVVNHEQITKGAYVYYRVDYEALFGYWFDPEDASRLKIIRFTDGSIINADEVYLHDLTEDAHYNYVNKKLLLLKLAGEDISQKKDTLQ